MNKFLFFGITLFCTHFFAGEAELMMYAKQNLSQTGVLRKTNGFVYLDIDDQYIYELIPFIQEAGFEVPPYFGKEGLVGAHISVIFPDELEEEELEECGEQLSFQLANCITVAPERFKGLVEFYFLNVEAPELDDLREKYGLPKNPYNYHITLGIKQKCPITLDASGHFQMN